MKMVPINKNVLITNCSVLVCRYIKVGGPFVETSCVFQCMKNIINAEMWA